MKKAILEICLSDGIGGLEIFSTECYKNFSDKTQCYMAIAPYSKLQNYFEKKEQRKLLKVKRRKFFPFISAWIIAKFIDEKKIDIIHFHWMKDSITVVLAKLISKQNPRIVQSRHMGMTRYKNDIYHRWIYKNIDLIHAVTKQVKEQIVRFVPQDICPTVEVVYLGADLEKKPNEKRVKQLQEIYRLGDSFVVGIIGRIEEGKGQWMLLEAIAKLRELDIKALIVGHTMDKEYLKVLQERSKALGIEERVIFTGFTTEVYEHFALMDVSVLATVEETFGLVVIEAMANRVAVIATNKGGPLEIIEDGVDGLLFDRSVEDLVNKISLLYHDRELLKNIQEKGYQKVQEKFDAKKQFKKLHKTIEEVVCS